MRKRSKVVLCGALATAVISATPVISRADVLYNSDGFEAPEYQVGPLAGQPTAAAANDQWSATTQGNIQTSVFQYSASTLQGVGMAVNATAGSYSYLSPNTNIAAPYTTTGDVNVTWTQRYASGATNNPVFGVTVFNGSDEVALLGIDATNNNFVIGFNPNDPTVTDRTFETTSFTGTPDTYINLGISLHYATGTFDIYENNVKLTSTAFSFVTPATSFTDADLTGFQVLGSSSFTGAGYFDNYLVTSSVPEPASASLLLGVSALGLARRRNTAY